jgi:selenocysteine-specific elongation factor
VVAVEGDRFIVRGFSRIPDAGWTFGGGRILDAAPPRARIPREERIASLRTLASDDPGASLAVRIKQAKLRGVREAELLREVRSLDGIAAVRVGSDRWLDPDQFEILVGRCVRAVEQHHREQPIDPWVGFAAVASRLPTYVPEEAIRAALAAAAKRAELEAAGSGHRRPGHAAHVADPLLGKKVLERLKGAGLAPPNLEVLARELDVNVRELRPVADHLVREQELVRVAAGLFFAREGIDDLRERLVRHLRKGGEIEPAEYKKLTGQTRKYTVPLMEFFDTEKLTVRRGNIRVLRGS